MFGRTVVTFLSVALLAALIGGCPSVSAQTATTISADIQIITNSTDDGTISYTGHYYHDSSRRRRYVYGQTVYISDPVARVSYILFTDSLSYMRFDWPSPTYSTRQSGSGQTYVDLGTQTIEGEVCHGYSYSSTIPANAVGNPTAVTINSQFWRGTQSNDMMQFSSSSSESESHTFTASNVQRNVSIPGALFQVPNGYTLVTTRPNVVQGCRFFGDPPVLIFDSFGPNYGGFGICEGSFAGCNLYSSFSHSDGIALSYNAGSGGPYYQEWTWYDNGFGPTNTTYTGYSAFRKATNGQHPTKYIDVVMYIFY